jgi:hypothetical protein
VEPTIGRGSGEFVDASVAQDVAHNSCSENVLLDGDGIREPHVVEAAATGPYRDPICRGQCHSGSLRRDDVGQIALDAMPVSIKDASAEPHSIFAGGIAIGSVSSIENDTSITCGGIDPKNNMC